MLKVKIICIGKLKEEYLRAAQSEYMKRLGGFCQPEVIELEEYRCPEKPSPAQIEKVLQEEGKKILLKIPASAYVTALCIEGKQMPSETFAQTIDAICCRGKSEILFVIGGSFGLSEEVKSRSDSKLSLSKMTLPHQLARVVLLEQVYRAFQINSGGKYHK